MEFDIFNVETKNFDVENKPLPCSLNSHLVWIGFSEQLIPCSYDSAGVLRGCYANDSYTWIPLLDTKPLVLGKQDYYWPVGVSENVMFMVICKVHVLT